MELRVASISDLVVAGLRKFYIYTDAFAQFEFQQNLFGIIRSEWRIRTAFFKFQ